MEKRLNSIKKITHVYGPMLGDSPIWWQNFVEMNCDNGLAIRLYDWEIVMDDISYNKIKLIFPSEEIYTQFVLTYS